MAYTNTRIISIHLNEFGISLLFYAQDYNNWNSCTSEGNHIITWQVLQNYSLDEYGYRNNMKKYIMNNPEHIKFRLERSNIALFEFAKKLRDFSEDEQEEFLLRCL
jgi:hypothetical protein